MKMETNGYLPKELSPSTYINITSKKHTLCPVCETIFSSIDGVACVGEWEIVSEESGAVMHGALLFCSLKCLLEVIDTEGCS